MAVADAFVTGLVHVLMRLLELRERQPPKVGLWRVAGR